jgi:hypothetical protein
MSYPRSRQYRHTLAAVFYVTLTVFAAGVALELLVTGSGTLAVVLLAAAGGLGVAGRRSLELADRNRVGADAESQVRRTLDRLRPQGWDVRHGVSWPGGGDVDHLLRSPAGVGFSVETKSRAFNQEHLERTTRTASWAAEKRRRYPRGVLPVLCVVRNRDLEHAYGDVLVVSLDRLERALLSRGGGHA